MIKEKIFYVSNEYIKGREKNRQKERQKIARQKGVDVKHDHHDEDHIFRR